MLGGPRFRRECAASCRCSRGTATQPHRCLLSLAVSLLAHIANRQYPNGPHVPRECACACGVYRGIPTPVHGAPIWGAGCTAPPSDKRRMAIDCGAVQYFPRVCCSWKTSFVSCSARVIPYMSQMCRVMIGFRCLHGRDTEPLSEHDGLLCVFPRG